MEPNQQSLSIRKKASKSQSWPIRLWPDTTDHPLLPLSLGGLCYLSDIEDKNESFAIQKTLFLGFPEVFAGGRDSHYPAIGWCISRKAVIINRDVFSAGGQRAISLQDKMLDLSLPAVMTKATTALSRECPVLLSDLSEIYGQPIKNAKTAIDLFRAELLTSRVLDMLSAIVAKQGGMALIEARHSLVEVLTNSINPDGFLP